MSDFAPAGIRHRGGVILRCSAEAEQATLRTAVQNESPADWGGAVKDRYSGGFAAQAPLWREKCPSICAPLSMTSVL